MKSTSLLIILVFALTAMSPGIGIAEDPAPAKKKESGKVSPVGTWKWTNQGRDGNVRKSSITVVSKEGKLAGTYLGSRGDKIPLKKVRLEGSKLSFETTRSFQNREITARYHGNIRGNKITGKVSMVFGDRSRERDWNAERAAVDISGKWDWSMVRDNGETWDSILTIKKVEGKLTGFFVTGQGDEIELSNIKVQGDKASWDVIRDTGDFEMKIHTDAKIAGDKMMGTVKFNLDGEERKMEWSAKRSN